MKKQSRWAILKPFDVYAKDGSGDVYLHRIRVLQTPWFAVYLHDLNLPDSDRDPHDHPWNFASLVLRGGYTERVWQRSAAASDGWGAVYRTHSRWSGHGMKRGSCHMIESVQPRTKTFVLTGPRKGSWGFWTLDGFVDWTEYVKEGETS